MSKTPYLPPLLSLTPDKAPWGSFGLQEFEASFALGKLEGRIEMAQYEVHTCPVWLAWEAKNSSAIYGIETSLEQIFATNAGYEIPKESRESAREAMVCWKAMEAGLEAIGKGGKITLPFIRSLHELLCDGTRGAGIHPGQWRDNPGYVGALTGDGKQKIIYTPPAPEHIQGLMENLEQFIHRDDLSPLVQSAVLLAQFELIQPFNGGSGRVGRMLIPILLVQKRILTSPCFSLSHYFQKHLDEYWDALGSISKKGDGKQWIEFFLKAVVRSADETYFMFQDMDERIRRFPRYAALVLDKKLMGQQERILDYVLSNPVFLTQNMDKALELHQTRQKMTHLMKQLSPTRLIGSTELGTKATIWKLGFLDMFEDEEDE